MVRHGNRGKRAGKRKVRKSGSICLKLVDGSVCRNLPAESAKTRQNYVIDCTDDVNSGAEGAVRAVALSASQNRSRSPASVPAPNRMVKTYWLSIMTLWLLFKVIAHQMTVGMSLKWASTERQRSVNDLRPSILENHETMCHQWSIIVLPAAFLGKYGSDKIGTLFQK